MRLIFNQTQYFRYYSVDLLPILDLTKIYGQLKLLQEIDLGKINYSSAHSSENK